MQDDKPTGPQGAFEETKHFSKVDPGHRPSVKDVLSHVSTALEQKGYRSVDQIVGYLITGDPAYITSHGDARVWIKKLERDEILEEILRSYLADTR